MLRTVMVMGTVAALACTSVPARADHDRELRYVLGGALIGAAIGELAYSSQYHPGYGYYYPGAWIPRHRHVRVPRYYPPARHYYYPRGVHHGKRHRGRSRIRHYVHHH